MLTFYHGTGAQDFELLGPAMHDAVWADMKSAAEKLLHARRQNRAADLLRTIPFELRFGTNVFGDDFTVMYVQVGLDEYVRLGELKEDKTLRGEFGSMAATISEIGPYVRFIAAQLDTKIASQLVDEPDPKIDSKAVERALRDAQQLLRASGAVSAVDRAHTALHGYLIAICKESGIAYGTDASVTDLFKLLREQHPAFRDIPHGGEIMRLLKSLANILDTLGTLRNRGSIAHPNDELLGEPEAVLALNCVRTALHYLDAKTP